MPSIDDFLGGSPAVYKEDRPWGGFAILSRGANFWHKIIYVKPGSRLSYQYHAGRTEHWVAVKGSGVATLEGKDIQLRAGDYLQIPVMYKHRVANRSGEPFVFHELAVGEKVDEADIVRIEDDYGRA
jgi:mannose-6-phosphate isomerase-like protein (cupin superfamily)